MKLKIGRSILLFNEILLSSALKILRTHLVDNKIPEEEVVKFIRTNLILGDLPLHEFRTHRRRDNIKNRLRGLLAATFSNSN